MCYTVKYSPEGEILWKHKFDDSTRIFENPLNIYLDDSSNVIIGGSIHDSTIGSEIFFLKLKQKTGTLVDNNATIPAIFKLNQNYPNPFNPTTTISYSLPKESHVELKVFDMMGREITTLVNKDQSAGKYNVQLDGSSLPSGIYVYSIKAGKYRDSKKLIVLK
jgi:hypothetical protein